MLCFCWLHGIATYPAPVYSMLLRTLAWRRRAQAGPSRSDMSAPSRPTTAEMTPLLAFKSPTLDSAYWNYRAKNLLFADFLTSAIFAVLAVTMMWRFVHLESDYRSILYTSLTASCFWFTIQIVLISARNQGYYLATRNTTAFLSRLLISVVGVTSINAIISGGEWHLELQDGSMRWGHFLMKAIGGH